MSVVGIDLGTTNTVVGCVRGGRVHVLADETGHRLLPSVVSFHPNGSVLVGRNAKERRGMDARNTVASVKRLIGRSWKSEEIAKARARFAFEMHEGPGQAPIIVARGQEYTLPEISAFVLKRAKQIAEAALNEPVERAVITVPANFNELQRASTKVAGRIAGLDVLRILNEPTAAALAYGLGKGGHERIAVYDFGGGTFDCTLLDLSGNVFEVLATAGDSFLGGDDIDLAIAERMAESFLLQHRYDAREDMQAFERLRIEAEVMKMELSAKESAVAKLREVAFGVGGAHLDLSFGLSRGELEGLAEPFVERTFKVCQDALALAGLAPGSFDKVILVGGSTRIPLVRRRVESFFGVPIMDRVNPDEVVGIGAAIQAAALTDVARRRSIPPPPVPAAANAPAKTTLKGITPNDEITKIQQAPAGESAPIGKVNLKSTVRMQSAPVPTGTIRIPARPPAPSSPGIRPTPPPVPPVPPARTSPSLAELDATDDEVTRQVETQKLAADMQAVRTVPGDKLPMFPRDPSEVLVDALPLVGTGSRPAESEAAPTIPGDKLAKGFLAGLADERMDTRPGKDDPTLTRPNVPVPVHTAPMLAAPPMRARAPSSPGSFPDDTQRNQAPPPLGMTMPLSPENTQPLPAQPAPPPPPPPQAAPVRPQTMRLHTPPPMPAVRPPSAAPPPGARPMTLPPGPGAPVLIDVTPRALVVETVGGFCDTIIPRNSKIPCERTRGFATGSDMQTVVRVRVAQGEAEQFGYNTYLGELELGGLRAAPRGEVTIAVTFGVDANGTLLVRAADVATGRAAIATLQLVGVAQEEAVARMVQRAANQRVSSGSN